MTCSGPPTEPLYSPTWCHDGNTFQAVTPVDEYECLEDQRAAQAALYAFMLAAYPPNC